MYWSNLCVNFVNYGQYPSVAVFLQDKDIIYNLNGNSNFGMFDIQRTISKDIWKLPVQDYFQTQEISFLIEILSNAHTLLLKSIYNISWINPFNQSKNWNAFNISLWKYLKFQILIQYKSQKKKTFSLSN